MGVVRSWRRPWICEHGHCRKDPVGTCVYVLICNQCGHCISVTTYGQADLSLVTGWDVKDRNHCLCKECK